MAQINVAQSEFLTRCARCQKFHSKLFRLDLSVFENPQRMNERETDPTNIKEDPRRGRERERESQIKETAVIIGTWFSLPPRPFILFMLEYYGEQNTSQLNKERSE